MNRSSFFFVLAFCAIGSAFIFERQTANLCTPLPVYTYLNVTSACNPSSNTTRCQNGLQCVTTQGGTTYSCQYINVTSTCTADSDCGLISTCISNTCQFNKYFAQGQACTIDQQCISNECVEGACASKPQGASCSGKDCAPGLYCNGTYSGGAVCIPQFAGNQSCLAGAGTAVDLRGICEPGYYCDQTIDSTSGAITAATCVLALSQPTGSTPGGFPAAYAEICEAGNWALLKDVNGLQFECVDEAPVCDNRIFFCSTAGLSQCNCGANETLGKCSPQVCPEENSNFLACLAKLPLGEYQDLQVYYDLNSAAYAECGDELLKAYCCIYQAQEAGLTPSPGKYFENPLCVIPAVTTGTLTTGAITTGGALTPTTGLYTGATYLIIFVFGVPFSGFDQAKVFNGICTYFSISPCDFAQFQNILAEAVEVSSKRQTSATKNTFTITPSDLTTKLLDLIASDQLAGLSAAIGYPILSASATTASSTAVLSTSTGDASTLTASIMSILISAILALFL